MNVYTKEYYENCIRKASTLQRKYAALYQDIPSKENLVTLQTYGSIITDLESKIKEIEQKKQQFIIKTDKKIELLEIKGEKR